MTEGAKSGSDGGWICNRCRVPLEVQTVRLQYLKTIFALNLPACPKCGMILIDEELATKMAEAEQALEDK
ncbi:MAG TPA: DNA-binding protein [Thermodesulfobacteriota bacterium]|jgi:predicted  nucleic acid-binding Zn-ribbon protein|nr:DNA-binding protein [Thermodesulfobacteriota bacterium]